MQFDFYTNPRPASHPDSLERRLTDAHAMASRGDFAAAEHLLRSIFVQDPNHLGALSLLAHCFRKMGRLGESLRCYKELFRASGDLQAQFEAAQIHYELEEDSLAAAIFESLMNRMTELSAETQFQVLKNLGNIRVRERLYDEASDLYLRAQELNPRSAILQVNFGTLAMQRDELDEAIRFYRQAIDMDAFCDRAWVGLALGHRAKGDFDLSWANLEKSLDLAPSNRTALKLMVEWAVRDARLSPAIERLQKHIGSDGEDAELAFELAKLYVLSGRLSEALLECERVAALDPGNEDCWKLQEVLRREVGRAAASEGDTHVIID